MYFENQNFDCITKEQVRICDYEFEACVFTNCKFNNCHFTNCSFIDCRFVNCTFFGLKFQNVQLVFGEFEDCAIVSFDWNILQAGGITFPIQTIKNCFLKYNNFEKMNLKKFDFTGSKLLDCTFAYCNLSESNFKNCDLQNTAFEQCDLKKADFRSAKGYNINLTANQTKGAKFSYPEVIDLLKFFDIIIEK